MGRGRAHWGQVPVVSRCKAPWHHVVFAAVSPIGWAIDGSSRCWSGRPPNFEAGRRAVSAASSAPSHGCRQGRSRSVVRRRHMADAVRRSRCRGPRPGSPRLGRTGHLLCKTTRPDAQRLHCREAGIAQIYIRETVRQRRRHIDEPYTQVPHDITPALRPCRRLLFSAAAGRQASRCAARATRQGRQQSSCCKMREPAQRFVLQTRRRVSAACRVVGNVLR